MPCKPKGGLIIWSASPHGTDIGGAHSVLRVRASSGLMQCSKKYLKKMGEKEAPALIAQMDKLLDQLGADFKAAWNAAEDSDDKSPDGKVLSAALDQLEDKCPE